MRREHDTIVVEVLDELSRLLGQQGPFHITVLAARANLPHDRLRGYLDELATMGLVLREPVPALTVKGRQFLDCYHAWVRIQRIYGIGGHAKEPAALVQAPRRVQEMRAAAQLSGSALPPVLASRGATPGTANKAAAAPLQGPAVVVAHDPFAAGGAAEPSVRGG